jgi:nucleoside-diphosphate-sugar epimerase
MASKLAVVTGANGWLGLNLLEALRDAGRAEGTRALVLRGTPVQPVKDISAAFDIRECDICDAETLKDAFRDAHTVFHCAGIIHAGRTGRLFSINTLGTRNVLDASASQGARRIIHISSNSVMGFNTSRDALFTEEMPCTPYKKYGRSKYLAELAVQGAQAAGRIETVILRPCWYYGKYQPERQNTFFRMIKGGRPPVFGSGENLRSITCIPNLVDAMMLVEESDKAAGETYWIADEEPYTINRVYETIARALEVKDFAPKHLPNFASAMCRVADGMFQLFGIYNSKVHVAGEMNRNIACSIEKAKRELGYKPKMALEECVRISVEWCRQSGTEI